MRYTITRSKAAAHAEQLQLDIGELCNGSTYDSDSYCLGSNPSSPAICLHGQAVKTLPSQGKIMGSIPIGGATKQSDFVLFFCFLLHVFDHGYAICAPAIEHPSSAEAGRGALLISAKKRSFHTRSLIIENWFMDDFFYKIVIQNITSLSIFS